MFITRLTLPSSIEDYEVHQHLHAYFDDGSRAFIYHKRQNRVVMLSIVRPSIPCDTVEPSQYRASRPFSFESDLMITKTKFIRGQAGTRYDIKDPSERREWLKKQLQGVAEIKFARFRHGERTIKGGLKRHYANCTGVLEIKEPMDFLKKIQEGIGRGKAFGCGMIYIPDLMGDL